MRVGARNRITGKVTDIKKGNLMCLVKLEVPTHFPNGICHDA